MHFGAEQQPSHSQQSHGRQSFASRQIGSTHWTFALGFVLVGRNCSSASSEEYSDEKIRTLPSLPKRIHFFEKEVRPSTVQGGIHRRGIGVKIYLEEEGNINGVVTAVEGNRLHVDKAVDNLTRTAANGSCIVDDALRPVCKIDAHIGQAVFVRTRIVYAVGIDAYSLTNAAADDIRSVAAGSVVRHSVSSYE